jgi:hypothetical protein
VFSTVPPRLELLTASSADNHGRSRAVGLCGASITGPLDLEACTLACPLLLEHCWFAQPVNLDDATTPKISLAGCYVPRPERQMAPDHWEP